MTREPYTLKKIFSETKFIHKNISGINNIIHDIEHIGPKIDDVYNLVDGELVKVRSVKKIPKNIFSIYTKSCYDLYKHVAITVGHACDTYQINKKAQDYMVYGKAVKYYKTDNVKWFDFPGQNVPFLHGFYFAKVDGGKVYFNDGKSIQSQNVVDGDLIINKPTDLIRIEVDSESDIIEFYVSPLFALKHNEPGVWVPII